MLYQISKMLTSAREDIGSLASELRWHVVQKLTVV